jgi:hypothetical protein
VANTALLRRSRTGSVGPHSSSSGSSKLAALPPAKRAKSASALAPPSTASGEYKRSATLPPVPAPIGFSGLVAKANSMSRGKSMHGSFLKRCGTITAGSGAGGALRANVSGAKFVFMHSTSSSAVSEDTTATTTAANDDGGDDSVRHDKKRSKQQQHGRVPLKRARSDGSSSSSVSGGSAASRSNSLMGKLWTGGLNASATCKTKGSNSSRKPLAAQQVALSR